MVKDTLALQAALSFGRYQEDTSSGFALLAKDCSDLTYGRRLHLDTRSCVECSIKRKKNGFHLLETHTAGRDRWFSRITIARRGGVPHPS